MSGAIPLLPLYASLLGQGHYLFIRRHSFYGARGGEVG